MSLFGRARAFFTGHFREAFAREPELPDEPPPPPSRGDLAEWEPEPRAADLPPGWQFEALYHRDTGMTPNPDPTDEEILAADAIIVSYTDALGKDYRTIHRAKSRKQIGSLITHVTIPDSPVR
jgi:hypothetical protein